MQSIELTIDVTEAAGMGKPMRTAVTAFLPDSVSADPPVVCFAFPGGGYCRRYFSFDMPDGTGGGQASFHCGNDATVKAVMQKLESGTLLAGYPRVTGATKLGIGQSMGGCFTIVAQAQLASFDGVGILGFSAIHTVVPSRPGVAAAVWPWVLRGSPLDNPRILNQAALLDASGPRLGAQQDIAAAATRDEHPFAWCFHFDDEPADIVALDMGAAAGLAGPLPEWRSAATPPCGLYMVAPGTVATEAASITVPVFVGVGERDVVPDPWMEPKAFKSSADISVFVCPRMGHMHNFAHTRREFWQRIHSWGTGVAASNAAKSATRASLRRA
jgi:pimeloyl-ACP methyl ester carboxylesterase